ncbi:DNA-binding GntR family transcriptional regulator [Martelella radicis]|uniref:DNA-binding GntR family transcriptional regulator n=2 Tax=Martelella radicis TaxID=1397476 RepID=A0A7W6KK01_9HYPH|nr:DNA-binding GntR family transcriptional regulator [Martelella radicis]
MAIENFGKPRGGPASGSSAPTARRAGRRSLTVYGDLQRDIMLGDIPPLTAILELDIAERFGCSQSTAREALIALDHDGLVDRLPHRGTFVADSRAEDARELIMVRREIECRGVPRIMQRYGSLLRNSLLEIIMSMVRAARAEDAYLLSQLDREFHLKLYEAANLPSVQPILRRCLIHNHRFKILNSKDRRDLVETAERHEAIVEALNSGDVNSAVATLSHHITTIVEFGPSILPEDAPEGR